MRGAAALAIAGLVWGAALAPEPSPTSVCEGANPPQACVDAATREPVQLLFSRPLDPNQVRAESLEVLPGIGPARAQAITRARCRAPFREVADLAGVPGIGPKTVARLRPWLEVKSSAAACAGP